ncbi:MAG TPA: hypothetical protein VFT19_05425, partial [Solirubrobacterales bacterium]|nr:hypothetical protein [Solirubrobacterales bacterium]
MAREQPINAGVPGARPHASPTPKRSTKPKPKPSRGRAPKRRQPIPTALKAIAGLFALAIVFIVAAILGGGGGSEPVTGPAPVGEAPSTPADAPPTQTPEDLGYPAFATANTTRVGGADPAANAAGAALAVYPSVTAAQQPDAVTVVDADEWRTAIAAAVLMAPPVAAPLLISEA